jgi:hypothetical protein
MGFNSAFKGLIISPSHPCIGFPNVLDPSVSQGDIVYKFLVSLM